MPFFVDHHVKTTPESNLQPGTPAALKLDELDGILPVYLADTAVNHRDEIARVVATLNRTDIGSTLLEDMRKLARAGAISTVEWHPERKVLPSGTWSYRRDAARAETGLSPETDFRRHASLIFHGLVATRNALTEKMRWSGKPLKADELHARLNRQLGELRHTDTTTDDFDGLLTADVASGMLQARESVMRHLRAINDLAEGRNLLRQFAALHGFGVKPLIDWNSTQMEGLFEPDGIPIWYPGAAGTDAIALKTLTAVRDALVKVAAGRNKTSETKIEKALGADRTPSSKETLDGVLTMNLTQAAGAVRADVVRDLLEIRRTGIGGWLLAELQGHAKAGRMIVLDNGPITGPGEIGGKPAWVYGRCLLEARGQDQSDVTPEEGRLCVAFSDLLTLANRIAEKQNSRFAPLPVPSLQRLFRDELLELSRKPRSGMHATTSATVLDGAGTSRILVPPTARINTGGATSPVAAVKRTPPLPPPKPGPAQPSHPPLAVTAVTMGDGRADASQPATPKAPPRRNIPQLPPGPNGSGSAPDSNATLATHIKHA